MAVTRVSQSTVKQGLDKNKNFVAGIPPILGRYYLMGSVTVGSGGASSIEFTDIPPIYKHLQVRGLLRSTTASSGLDDVRLRLGNSSIDTGNNYAAHQLEGNGSSTQATGYASVSFNGRITYAPRASATATVWAAIVFDILDYANTSKTTTVRSFAGVDLNGSGSVVLSSTLWNNTSAITNVQLFPEANNFAQHSTLALYGIGRVSQ